MKTSDLMKVVLDASLEVRSAVVYASFIVALVFLPVLTLSGLHGRFFAPLATSFILAILASLVVALTVTPALCLLLLARARPREEPRYLGGLKAFHRRALQRVSRRPLPMGRLSPTLGRAEVRHSCTFAGWMP